MLSVRDVVVTRVAQVCVGPPADAVTVTRGVEQQDDDDVYWLSVPRDERARLTWDLSSQPRGVRHVGQDDLERFLELLSSLLTLKPGFW